MKPVKVAIDAMGGDNAPQEIVRGAVEALDLPGSPVLTLFGDEETIRGELEQIGCQSDRIRVEWLPANLAVASLMGCVAFPWVMPELADRLLAQVEKFVAGERYGILHFTREASFWTSLIESLGSEC